MSSFSMLSQYDAPSRTFSEGSFRSLPTKAGMDGRCLVIAAGTECNFLRGNNACAIYPTRPNVCVTLTPDSDQCSEARHAEALPPLG